MSSVLLNFFPFVIVGTYLASFLYFDRLLLVEARLHQDDWKRDGSPVGIYTWAREAGAKLRPWYDGVALLLFLRLYVCWLFRAPSWIHEDAAAHRSLNLARSLFWLLVVEMIVCKALM